eukprot:CAMPEP_0202962530 /NCGR_PEP_ID=MMETSP1396-20130829/6637_1 /ASSEMBLY_ACC=CAM_ASM_000872 /TAXON_ID= /ORGANISM="Pseudokeronopsis sp., Strain Brazil" /LENGTH=71 /DNA_ID=CAMNT_0049683181 /DNA_START=182 /DNA_END=397 /DNA_ORIENTATION=+
MYMRFAKMSAQQKGVHDYIDVSKFTGMDVEHRHDTANEIPHEYDPHAHPSAIKDFQAKADKEMGSLRKKAL